MTADSYSKLIAQYMDVAKKSILCREQEESQVRRNVVEHVFKLISKDLKALNNLDKNNPGKIQDAFETSRAVTVNISGDLKHRMGGQASDRFPMKNGDKKGFFTARTDTAHDKEWDALINKIGEIGMSKEQMKPFEQLRKNHQARKKIEDSILMAEGSYAEVYSNIALDLGVIGEKEAQELYDAGGYKAIADSLDKKVLKGISTLFENSEKLLTAYHLQRRLGYDFYTRNDNKNAAMYDVAKFLGCEKLVAKAVPMIVVNGKNVMKGTYMENALGSDLANLKGDDDLFKYNSLESPFNMSLYKDLADLQVLDYICGNIDRHKGNMIYKTQRDKDNRVTLTGVTAIDNDASFPERDILKSEFISQEDRPARIFKPENFRYVNKKTAEIIKNMDRAQLETVLRGNNLSKKAIDLAWKRAKEVKNVLEKMTEYNISYVEELDTKIYADEYDEKNPFCNSEDNQMNPSIFTGFNKQMDSEIAEAREDIENEQSKRLGRKGVNWNGFDKEEYKTYQNKQQEINEKKTAKVQAMDKDSMLRSNFKLIESMDTTMKRINRLKFASFEFSSMRKAIYALSKCSKDLSAKMDLNKPLHQMDYDRFENLMNKVKSATENYIQKKGVTPKTEAGRERQQGAFGFLNKSEKLFDNFEEIKKMDAPEADMKGNEQDIEYSI
jgi:hypothetical protein